MSPSRVVRPVRLDGEEFFVAGRLEARGMAFWVEKPKGKLWIHINEFVGTTWAHLLDVEREIVALTWDDSSTILREVAKKCGWFEFTGRTVNHPVNQVNEIWRLTPECLSELKPASVTRTIRDLFQEVRSAPEPPTPIHQLVGSLLQQIKPMGFSALAMLRPDPVRYTDRIAMTLSAASADVLVAQGAVLEDGPGYRGEITKSLSLETEHSAWAIALRGIGYRSALVVRIPAGNLLYYEFVLLSTSVHVQDASVGMATVAVMRDWPKWRQLIQNDVCTLTQRERETLLTAATGHNGASAAEVMGISERTYRLYTDNAKKKLNASSTAEAIYRAQLLCVF